MGIGGTRFEVNLGDRDVEEEQYVSGIGLTQVGK